MLKRTDQEEKKPSRGSGAAKRELFSKSVLNKLLTTRPHRQHMIWDKKEPHLCVLVSRGQRDARRGTVTFRAIYYLRNHPGKPNYIAIGRWPDGQYTYPGSKTTIQCSDIDAVRRAASNIYNRAKDEGIDPRRPPASGQFADVVAEFMADHVAHKRSQYEIKRIFDTYVLPEWGNREITEIKRIDVAILLTKIKTGKIRGGNGQRIGSPTMANAVLAQISKLFNWYAARSDEYVSPIVKGMLDKKDKPKARDRVLTDDELRLLWPLLNDTYGAVIKCALLTAQRFHKVSTMRRADLKSNMTVVGHMRDGQWIEDQKIQHVWDPTRKDDPDNKAVSVVPLSKMARDVIASVPVIDGDGDYVFSLDGDKPMQGWSKFNQRLDKAMRDVMQQQGIEFRPWQHRDLRRTAKTLMMRAGVSRDISERCLGHEFGGVEGVYDRYDYLREKQDAFARLAEMVERIVNPPNGNGSQPSTKKVQKRRHSAH
jgi:integrase